MPSSARSDRRWAWGIFALAVALRVAHVLTIRDAPFFTILYIDPLMYDEWGQRIAAGQWLSERSFFLDPLYAYFLGAIYALFGHRYTAVVAIQGLLGAAVVPLVHAATRRWFDPAVARTAGVIAAIYLPSIFFGGILMKPALTMFLLAVVIWLFAIGLAETRGAAFWLSTGAVLGLAIINRGNLLLVLPALLAWLALDGRRVRPAAWLLAGVLPWLGLCLAHNYAVSGEPVLTSANAGANFYIGNNPANHTGEYQQLPFIRANPKWEQTDFKAEAERRSGRQDLADREISRFWFAQGLAFVREQPGAWLLLMARKVHVFWGAWEVPDSLDYYLYREHAPVLRLPIPGFGLLAPLALTGMALVARRRGWPRLLVLLCLTYAATVIVFFVFSRFRAPIAPALYVLAAVTAVELVRRVAAAWRGGPRRPAGVALACFLACFAFVNLPVRARTDSWGYRLASAAGLPLHPETSALGHLNLGKALAARAKDERSGESEYLDLAERELRAALDLALGLDHATIHVELGKVLAREGRDREAIDVYRQGLTLEPGSWHIHHALGLLERRSGDPVEAAAQFRNALELEPRRAASAVELGQTLLELGRGAEAADAFRRALEIAPGDARALAGLARATAR